MSELLCIKFELLFAPLLEVEEGKPRVDIMNNIELLIPEDPIYSILATQSIYIQACEKGIHEYIPVSFKYIGLMLAIINTLITHYCLYKALYPCIDFPSFLLLCDILLLLLLLPI